MTIDYRLRFNRLQGTNVCCYKHFDVNLANQGTVLFTGDNGSGKSTLGNVICFMLYGVTPKGLKYGSLVNIHDPKDYWTRLDFERDGIPYAIEQYRLHSKYGKGTSVYRDGKQIKLKGADATKAYIKNLIGIDRRAFLSTVFLAQDHNHVLIEGTPAIKEKHIMWIFGLNTYETLADKAKKHYNALQGRVEDVKRLRDEFEDVCAQLKKLKTLTQLKDRLIRFADEKRTLSAEIDVLESREDTLSDKVGKIEIRDELINEFKELGVKGSPTASDVEELRKDVEDLTQELSDARHKIKLARKVAQIRKELKSYKEIGPTKELREDLERVRSRRLLLTKVTLPEAERANELRKKINKLKGEGDLETLEDREADLDKRVGRLEKSIANISHRLKKGVCPTCKRPWGLSKEELSDLEQDLTAKRADLAIDRKKYYTVHALLEDVRSRIDLGGQLAKLTKEDSQDVEIDIQTCHRDEKGIKSDLAMAEERERLKLQVKEAPEESASQLSQDIEQLQDELSKLNNRLTVTSKAHDLLERIGKLPSGNFKELKRELKDTRLSLKESRSRFERVSELLILTKEKIKKVKRLTKQRDDFEELIRESEKAKRDADLWDALKNGFHYLLRKRERELLARITQDLPAYTGPLFGNQAKWLKAEICKEKSGIDMRIMSVGKQLPVKGPSPGMKAKFGLASVFALRDLYAANQCNLLILDEPIDRIDAKSRPGFLDIVQSLKSKTETLIVISHESEIKGSRFDRHWHASIKRGISTLEFEGYRHV